MFNYTTVNLYVSNKTYGDAIGSQNVTMYHVGGQSQHSMVIYIIRMICVEIYLYFSNDKFT